MRSCQVGRRLHLRLKKVKTHDFMFYRFLVHSEPGFWYN